MSTSNHSGRWSMDVLFHPRCREWLSRFQDLASSAWRGRLTPTAVETILPRLFTIESICWIEQVASPTFTVLNHVIQQERVGTPTMIYWCWDRDILLHRNGRRLYSSYQNLHLQQSASRWHTRSVLITQHHSFFAPVSSQHGVGRILETQHNEKGELRDDRNPIARFRSLRSPSRSLSIVL